MYGENWMFIILTTLFLIYLTFVKVLDFIKNRLLKKVLTGVFKLFLFTTLALSLKIFVLGVFKIPSSSMKNTLFPKDIILVNKLKYGPKLPRSPFDIPLINIAFYFNKSAKKRIKEYWWPYKRLSGTTTIKQGDIFVFNSTWSKDFILVKRCIALPGDTLTIDNAKVYTNNRLFTGANTEKNKYKFTVKNIQVLRKVRDSFSYGVFFKSRKDKFIEASLTKLQLKHLKEKNYIENVTIQIDTFIPNRTFVKSPILQWTLDNMGPIIVPKKGMKITLNEETFEIYKKAISSSESCKITKNNDSYFIDDKKVTSYTFKKDYYFMMGDNRKKTMDSRRWGFVIEENIIGKVQCVLFSNFKNKFQWNRFLKGVDLEL